MEIIYKANDGTLFDDEYECEKHERGLKEKELLDNGIIFLDYYNEKINAPIYNSEKVYHIYFPTSESIELFNKSYEVESDDIVERLNKYEEVVSNRWYHYDDLEGTFFSYEYRIKENQEKIEEYDTLLGDIKRAVK